MRSGQILFVLFLVFFRFADGRASADLVAHYSMNEGTGQTAYDVSGHENHGRINGAEWVTGAYGTALRFDGSSGDDVN